MAGSYKHGNEAPHSINCDEFLHLVIKIYNSFPGLSFGRLVGCSVSRLVGRLAGRSAVSFLVPKQGEFLHQLCHYKLLKADSAPKCYVV